MSHSFFRYDYNVAWRHHYGGWGANYYGHTAVRAHIYREGTLAIDFFDDESGHPSWHGWATKTITEADRANECVRVSARHRLISIRPDVRMTVSMSGSDRSPRAEG